MGYYSRIELVNVQIKGGCVAGLKRYIKEHKSDEEGFGYFLNSVRVESGFLVWDFADERGKWYSEEEFARWLASYAAGGRVILHSEENDGSVWGWEFDGQGKMRYLALLPDGDWQ